MMHKVLKSELAPFPVSFEEASAAFGRLVDGYFQELQTWRDHDLRAKAQQPMRPHPTPDDHAEAEDPALAFWKDQAAWHIEKRARFEPYPMPIAHPYIIASIATNIGADGNITYSPDFEVVNDDPTPEQILTAKKMALLQAVIQAELGALKDAQLPVGKQRAANILEGDIRARDSQLVEELVAYTKANRRKNIDIATEVEIRRDPAHTRHLADQESRRAKVDAIVRATAQIMSDIEDLTLAEIDAFEIPSTFDLM